MQFLVIARISKNTDTTPEQAEPYIKPEAEKVWEYYTTDVVRSIHYIADMSGAVLMLEADNLEAAKGIVAQFPMAKDNILNFDILPLKPYMGLETLFAQ